MEQHLSYIFALGANIAFALASLVYTHYSHKISVVWVNFMKAGLATIACAIVLTLSDDWSLASLESFTGVAALLASGLIGLMIGDIFLLNAFKVLGPGRSLLLFGFHPLILGAASYFLFGQTVDSEKLWAILFLLACLIIFSIESRKKTKSWGLVGIAIAITAILFDAVGILFTRYGFELSPQISPMEGNFYRCLGASLGFCILTIFRPIGIYSNFKKLGTEAKYIIVLGSLLGTFLSLYLYLTALKFGHIASITAITVTSPFFASIFECIYNKQKPSKYLLLSFGFFLIGFYILL